MGEAIEIGAYLWRRVRELGVKSIFGVPGDFELTLLDEIPPAGLEWVGTANELIGAYAADGYARFNGMGVVVTTFGPGELSALNGIAGAYAENIPVLHIVGYPSTHAQANRLMIHHTLGDGRYGVYHEMSKPISCATAVLSDPAFAASEIDRVLEEMLKTRKPGYIGVPSNFVHQSTGRKDLNTDRGLISQDQNITQIGEIIKKRIISSKKLAIIVDTGAARYGALPEVEPLINILNAPYFVTLMGKGSVDETSPLFGGTWAGAVSQPSVVDFITSCDCVIKIGNVPSDLNTGLFTEKFAEDSLIDVKSATTEITGTTYSGGIHNVLSTLVKVLSTDVGPHINSWPMCVHHRLEIEKPPIEITFDWFLTRLQQFLRPDDLILVETGSVSLGMIQVTLPEGAFMFNQTLWGSIGYTTGAAVGTFTAANEQKRFKRKILLTGEGSIQMTIQALGDLMRLGHRPIIIVLNNSGYTCERYINGPTASYNDITTWDWQKILPTFGPDTKSKSYQSKTTDGLDELLSSPDLDDHSYTHLIEVIMDKFEAPTVMKKIGTIVAQRNSGSASA